MLLNCRDCPSASRHPFPFTGQPVWRRTQNFFLPTKQTRTSYQQDLTEQLNPQRISILFSSATIQNHSSDRLRTNTLTHTIAVQDLASSPPTRNWPVYDNVSAAPSCKGSPLPRTHLQSHHQVKRYICVICISHPTPTTSDTSRLSSCNHFAYRGNLVAPTSVATANPPPLSRMSR